MYMFCSTEATIDALRTQLREIDRAYATDVLPLGLSSIDSAMPGGGLPQAAMHEIVSPDPTNGAALAFAAFVTGRLVAKVTRPILWVTHHAELYPPGLVQFGLPTDRLLLAQCRTYRDALWAMEEGLRCDALAGVVGDTSPTSFNWSRRLHLAARQTGRMLLLLRPERSHQRSSAAQTRWRVTTAPSAFTLGPGPGEPVWQLDLLRCRGGVPQSWLLQFDPRGCRLTEASPNQADQAQPLERAA